MFFNYKTCWVLGSYSLFAGCPKGTACVYGMICGQPGDLVCKSCTFEECLNNAQNKDSFGFSYRIYPATEVFSSNSNGFCRLCNETEFTKARWEDDYGLYIKG